MMIMKGGKTERNSLTAGVIAQDLLEDYQIGF